MRSLAIGLLLAGAGAAPPQEPIPEIEVEWVDGEAWCTLVARDFPLRQLIGELALAMELSLSGLEHVPADRTVTVELHDRRLGQALLYALLPAGLIGEVRGDELRLSPAPTAAAGADELRQQALLGYLRLTRDFPDHPAMPAVRLAQARTELARGNAAASRRHFETLLDQLGDSPEAAPARLELGELLMRMEEHAGAATQFAEYLKLKHTPELTQRAWLNLADCKIEQGQHESARFLLAALDSQHPAKSQAQRQERLYLRARALTALDRCEEALGDLDAADSFGVHDPQTWRLSLGLRAPALEGLGQLADASRAWLVLSEELEGEEQADALAEAARTALEARDFVAVLFVGEMARQAGCWERLRPSAARAREALSLDGERPRGGGEEGLDARLARGERLLEAGLAEEALQVFDLLALARDGLDEETATRLALARARALERVLGLEPAIDSLRVELGRLAEPAHRLRLWALAADLFEAHGRLDAAIDALQGRLSRP